MLSIASFLAHLSSVVILGVACITIALLDFARDRTFRSLIVKLSWPVSPALLMLSFLKGGGHVGTIEWGALYEKLIYLLAPIRSYSTPMDLADILVLLVCAIMLFRGSKLHSGAVVSLVLFALLMVTPKVLFTSSGADARYVLPAICSS